MGGGGGGEFYFPMFAVLSSRSAKTARSLVSLTVGYYYVVLRTTSRTVYMHGSGVR